MYTSQSIIISTLKKIKIIDILFYASFLISVIISIYLDIRILRYAMPFVIATILLKYINLTKNKAQPLFVFALLVMLLSDILSFYDFKTYFVWISILVSIYLICCTLILKRYINIGKLKPIWSISVLISALSTSYIIYTTLKLLINIVPNNQVFFVVMCATCLIIYAVTFAIIYLNDNYSAGTILLTSGIFMIFQITLSSINKFLYFDKTFSVLTVICHVISIYLFMKFITETEVIQSKDIKENFI